MKWNHQASMRPAMAILLDPLLNSSQFQHPPSSYATVFQAFTGKNLLKLGQQLHAHIEIRGLRPTPFLAAKMVAMYASSGDITSAARIFHSVQNPSLLLFNSIVRAYSLYKYSEETLQIFTKLHSLNLRGDYFTYPFVLKSVANLELLRIGKCIHSMSMRDGLEFDLYVATSLIVMYVKCGKLADARRLFDEMPVRDVSSWNSLISGYMKEGAVDSARELFEEMPTKNIVSWTSMISGYTQNGLAANALQLFDKMLGRGSDLKPNWVTIMSVLPACAHSSALEQGRRIHGFAREEGLDGHPSVQTALVGMYAKCGSLPDAKLCFDRINPRSRSLVAWNSMISAYASHGRGEEAVHTFDLMVQEGFRPDSITFTGLLSGCSHSGLVELGLRFFDSMSSDYQVEKRHEHYACIVDLLGRAGRLVEAYEVISKMPMPAGASVWGSLLAAGRSHRNLEISELSAKKLFELEKENSGNYVILANMYAEAAMWDEAKALRALQKSQNVRKNPGCSWVENDGNAIIFLGGDDISSNPQTVEI
ncbi:pentatricopeptide repeat-containing protein At5g08510-like [Salvia hispanica]|uniref:pentatricopeptide repeat-containing protein At5g08510-like n=1 Tax=Salvia hispanica TaxID=49212 RepID=UPI002009B0E2|nr:pentatricopeptide repeat-containing protein At5g08510-like [Salvia hispanica]